MEYLGLIHTVNPGCETFPTTVALLMSISHTLEHWVALVPRPATYQQTVKETVVASRLSVLSLFLSLSLLPFLCPFFLSLSLNVFLHQQNSAPGNI